MRLQRGGICNLLEVQAKPIGSTVTGQKNPNKPCTLIEELIASSDRQSEIREQALRLPSIALNPRQLCDLEVLLSGGFSPLEGYLGEEAYTSVLRKGQLPDGSLWPIPICLDVTTQEADDARRSGEIALRDIEGHLLAVLTVESIWAPDKRLEAQLVYGTERVTHPGVRILKEQIHNTYIGGKVEGVSLPKHYDFETLRKTPAECHFEFAKRGWNKVIAFQTRNPMHRAHFELTMRAMEEYEASLLIHPVVGTTKPGDITAPVRVRCYQELMRRYPNNAAMLSVLPLAMRMAGPREALWHALIRKNYGCTHFIIGRDHAGPGKDEDGVPFYGPYEAQDLVRKCGEETGIYMVPFRLMVFVPGENKYKPVDEVKKDEKSLTISGTELRERLRNGKELPEWFTFPEVAKELRRVFRPKPSQGICLFFTGLSGAGKSTIANILKTKLEELGSRRVTLLDGDHVRKNLSSELGFSKEHRDLNVRRIGFVANEIAANGGIAICAPIAPYDAVRKEVRATVKRESVFLLIHIATSLEVCEERDTKGLYAKARAGLIDGFTGISDPYEAPADADITIDASQGSPEEAAWTIVRFLIESGYIQQGTQIIESDILLGTPSLATGDPIETPVDEARKELEAVDKTVDANRQ